MWVLVETIVRERAAVKSQEGIQEAVFFLEGNLKVIKRLQKPHSYLSKCLMALEREQIYTLE